MHRQPKTQNMREGRLLKASCLPCQPSQKPTPAVVRGGDLNGKRERKKHINLGANARGTLDALGGSDGLVGPCASELRGLGLFSL